MYNTIYTNDVSTEVFLKAAAISADIKYIWSRNSGVDIEALNNSESGSHHYGEPDSYSVVQANKTADLQLSL